MAQKRRKFESIKGENGTKKRRNWDQQRGKMGSINGKIGLKRGKIGSIKGGKLNLIKGEISAPKKGENWDRKRVKFGSIKCKIFPNSLLSFWENPAHPDSPRCCHRCPIPSWECGKPGQALPFLGPALSRDFPTSGFCKSPPNFFLFLGNPAQGDPHLCPIPSREWENRDRILSTLSQEFPCLGISQIIPKSPPF